MGDQQKNYLLEKAIHFSTTKHAGQLRKGTTVPYIVHPLETMNILRTMNADTNLLIAGLLHDTVNESASTKKASVTDFMAPVSSIVLSYFTLVSNH